MTSGLLSVILLLPGTAAQAGHYYNGHGDDVLIAAGIIGGTLSSRLAADAAQVLPPAGLLPASPGVCTNLLSG